MTKEEALLIDTNFEQPILDTGWRCSICSNLAQVMMCGETMCVEHAEQWKHGYGKSIKEMRDALPHSTLSDK